MTCPCGSERNVQDCCERLIQGNGQARTAEELMRARYTAYTRHAIDFVERTHDPRTRHQFDRDSSREWAENTTWKGLEILATEYGGPDDDIGTVEFKALFETEEGVQEHHELSQFRKLDGQWYFLDGADPRTRPVVRSEPKIGRNDPCPCGSGKKYKKCCG